MNYEQWKAKMAELYALLEAEDAKMSVFPKRPDGGTPEAVRVTPEFQKARGDWAVAFENVRRFNGQYVRQFRKEIAADRRFK